MNWPGAARDRGTVCVSCHTVVPYALARPALRAVLGEKESSEPERRLLESVTKRVQLGNQVGPFYTESSGPDKPRESRGTESVLNAFVLAGTDAPSGKLRENTLTAFERMWASQNETGEQGGAWPWLDFGNEPFEAKDSRFYGAALAAVALGMAPENYRESSAIQSNVKRLRDYLNREYSRQPVIHQVVLLWASTKWSGLLTGSQQKSLLDDILARQESDGGWSLASLGWTWRGPGLRTLFNLWIRSNDTPWAHKSDGYATGLTVLAMQQAGIHSDNPQLQRGRSWLIHNQDVTKGTWPGYSLVNRRNPESATGLFMTDAATAYAVLALTAETGR